jgi:hypothetical protein
MTEQIEDDFWATERARDTAARGRQADPSACGTCKTSVEAGGQVKHDECAQRALLLPAPDAPAWELITGLSEEELAALPPRFHVPAYMESSTPQMWVCAVCWGEGWVTGWPCKTAVKHGLRVFTPEHEAETTAKRQTAELAELRQKLGRVTANRDYWRDRYRSESRTTWSSEVPPGGEVCADCGEPVESEPCAEHNPAALVEQLRARITELEAERAKYVGVEPTIAEEMAYLSRCLDAVHEACDRAVRQATRWEHPLPIPEWVDTVRQAADGATEPLGTRPALPWAHVMDDADLGMFLDDLVSAALGRWRSEPDLPLRTVLADIEKACADWRTLGRGLRGDEAGTAGP